MPSNRILLLCAQYSLSPIHPHVAELAEVKRLYEGDVIEMSQLKHRPQGSQTSLDKVCSLLAVLFWECHHLLNKWASLNYWINLKPQWPDHLCTFMIVHSNLFRLFFIYFCFILYTAKFSKKTKQCYSFWYIFVLLWLLLAHLQVVQCFGHQGPLSST